MERPPLYSRSGRSSPNITNGLTLSARMDATENYQSLLQHAQQFSQLAMQHLEQVRIQFPSPSHQLLTSDSIDGVGDEKISAVEELAAAYDKLSKLKWDAVRKEYEASYRRTLEADNRTLPNNRTIRQCEAKTPGKKREEKPNNPITHQSGINPHDWIADAFRNGGLDSLEVTNGKDSFSLSDCFPSLGVFPPLNPPSGLGHPPGFGRSVAAEEESCGSSEKSEDKDTTQSTSTPSEVSSLHTDEGSCCENGEDSSVGSMESCDAEQEGEFDYIYRGGYAMRVINGQETKGVVPKTVKNVFVHSSVTSIEEGAFQGCNDLESVTISCSIVNIQNNAFRKCSKLKNVAFLTRSSKSTSGNRDRISEEKKIENYTGVNRPPARRSTSATSRSSTRAASQLRSIGEWAFFNCSSLESVNLPFGLESIGSRAFQRCSALKLEELPSTLVSVGESAFYGCSRETRAVLERWESTR